ncbi:LacI family transcriptional regulator [Flavobacteriaceae bacterium]|nr:LacI family transcriptional regulator [Flavobacteriaceae bacterium]
MARSKINLKELASILGVSISTISKALNDSHEISDATKKRIVELAKLHNYRPNKIALGLKSGRTNTIAVVIPSVQNSFFARALYGIESVISQTKYSTIVCLTKESYDKEVDNFDMLSNGVVDGFIVAVSEETQMLKDFSHFENAISDEKSLVMFDRVIDSIPCTKVTTNDYTAISEATQNLIKSNRKNIILLSAINNLNVGKQRTKGYRKAIQEAGLEPVVLESNRNGIVEVLKNHIESNPVDAVIALDTDASFASYKVARQFGKKIPEDMAVIGYVSERMAPYLAPELTTINQHSYTMGKTAATLLLEQLENKSNKNQSVVIDSTLSQRASS